MTTPVSASTDYGGILCWPSGKIYQTLSDKFSPRAISAFPAICQTMSGNSLFSPISQTLSAKSFATQIVQMLSGESVGVEARRPWPKAEGEE